MKTLTRKKKILSDDILCSMRVFFLAEKELMCKTIDVNTSEKF